MYIPRFYDNLEQFFEPKRVLIVFGPRRVGKTTLLRTMLSKTDLRFRFDSGENILVQEVLSSQDFSAIDNYLEDNQLVALDEAQTIPNIGMGLKIIIDQHPDLKVIATGSSSFDLSLNVGEPLTGRKTVVTLYPISQLELLNTHNKFDLKQKLSDYLIFGSYPEVLTSNSTAQKISVLEELTSSYLFKDILALDGRKGTKFVLDLVKMLALQLGSEVSTNKLAVNLKVDAKTVERYLDLLEQTFIIKRLGSFSRNLRSELTRKQKYYFIDNGVRNAVISQINSLDKRSDVGALFENFLFIERLKKRTYQKAYGASYFWRTYGQQEIDLIEEKDGKLFAYEFKWSDKHTVRVPKEWADTYPEAEFKVITSDNYLDFIT